MKPTAFLSPYSGTFLHLGNVQLQGELSMTSAMAFLHKTIEELSLWAVKNKVTLPGLPNANEKGVPELRGKGMTLQ